MLPSDADVMNEGFRPLKRIPTTPMTLPHNSASKGEVAAGGGKRNSFCDVATGEMETAQGLWENSPWGKMERGMGRLERANSFVAAAAGPEGPVAADPSMGLVAVVDPFSTGAQLAAQAAKLGYGVVRVFSIWDSPVAALIQEGVTVDYFATVQFNDQDPNVDEATNRCVRDLQNLPLPVVAVLPGAETGVELADRLAHRMRLRGNGEEGSFARRNKYDMGEKVRRSGTRAVKQRLCRSESELTHYLTEELGIPAPQPGKANQSGAERQRCVVKPVQSAGSDCVYLCDTFEEAMEAFGLINGKRNGLGLINDGALVQEFLSGKEYVIDKVSKDGVHKVVAVWEYDKRVCNGHNFVYFGNRLRPADSPRAQEMIKYADAVLDALEIYQGPSHMEVMYTSTGPCLVEVGSRCQGGEGTWITIVEECIGYSQVEVTMDVYMNGSLFDSLPKDTYTLKKAGRDVDLVSRHAGLVRSLPGDAVIRSLPSFRAVSWEIHPGDFCPMTIDCFTRPACVQLVHDSEEQADRDFELLHELEDMRLIDYAVICPKPPPMGAVVVVDPFSSGAHLAAMVLRWGFKLILVFSCHDHSGGAARVMADSYTVTGVGNTAGVSEVHTTTAVGSSSHLKPSLLVQHSAFEKNQVKALDETVAAVRSFETTAPILAVLAGAETGVDLADRLSEAMGTRSNGSKSIALRQSKFSSAAAVSAAGVITPRQCLATSEDDVKRFWAEIILRGDSRPCMVMKPDNSIEGDGVTVCDSEATAVATFRKIYGQFNMLSRVNEAVLCMERVLGGVEYIVDTVSRNGQAKVVAVWECDKVAVTPALSMVYGMKLRDASRDAAVVEPLAKAADDVLTALGIAHGPAHTKFIVTEAGPIFICSRACCQAGDASWLPVAKACIGYDILETTLNAYLRPDQYDELPKIPLKLLKQGMDVNLFTHHSGLVKSIPGLAPIRALSSVACVVLFTQPGSHVARTTNRMSRAGSVQLMTDTQEQLEKDYLTLKEMELSNMVFELQ